MVIWTRWGIVVGLLGFACLILTQLGVNAAMQDRRFYQDHGWPKMLGLWIVAATSWPLGRYMNRDTERHLVDPASGRPHVGFLEFIAPRAAGAGELGRSVAGGATEGLEAIHPLLPL